MPTVDDVHHDRRPRPPLQPHVHLPRLGNTLATRRTRAQARPEARKVAPHDRVQTEVSGEPAVLPLRNELSHLVTRPPGYRDDTGNGTSPACRLAAARQHVTDRYPDPANRASVAARALWRSRRRSRDARPARPRRPRRPRPAFTTLDGATGPWRLPCSALQVRLPPQQVDANHRHQEDHPALRRPRGPIGGGCGSSEGTGTARTEAGKSGSPGMIVGEVTRTLVRMGV